MNHKCVPAIVAELSNRYHWISTENNCRCLSNNYVLLLQTIRIDQCTIGNTYKMVSRVAAQDNNDTNIGRFPVALSLVAGVIVRALSSISSTPLLITYQSADFLIQSAEIVILCRRTSATNTSGTIVSFTLSTSVRT